jgi:hypothetical protein
MTHPGVGPIVSLAYVLTIGDWKRFARSKELASYTWANLPVRVEKRTSAAKAVRRAANYGTAEPVPFVR